MPISFNCAHCGKPIGPLSARWRGRTTKCPHCGEELMVPGLTEADLLEMRKSSFLASLRKAGSWADPINRHWKCADVLYERAVEAKEKYSNWLREQHEGLRAGTISLGQRRLEAEESQIVLNERHFIHEYFLLIGYALECGYKGYLFARDPSLVSDTLEVDDSIRNHDLYELCRRCDIDPLPEEEALLRHLTYQITHGKYPAPTNFRETEKQPKVADLHRTDQYVQRVIADRLIFQIGSMLDELRETPLPEA